MGLDNGIVLRTRKRFEVLEKVGIEYKVENVFVTYDPETEQDVETPTDLIYEYDVTYWRKCWNIRGIVVDAVGKDFEDGGDTYLNRGEIDEIIKGLNAKNSPEIWNRDCWNGETIWDADEMHITCRDDRNSYIYYDMRKLAAVALVLKELENDKDSYRCWFYDSY